MRSVLPAEIYCDTVISVLKITAVERWLDHNSTSQISSRLAQLVEQ